MNGHILIVSNKFENLSKIQNVYTVNQILDSSEAETENQQEIIIGQGINEEIHNKINSLMLSRNVKNNQQYLLRNNFTHKKKEKNILIGEITQKNESEYYTKLTIDEECELMDDHQTGRHIQGMIIIEAFRQTFIAVTEEFNLSSISGDKYYVINTINIDYLNFLFPIPASIAYIINESNIISNKRGKFNSELEIVQNGIVCAKMKIVFTVYPAAFIANKENELSISAIKKLK